MSKKKRTKRTFSLKHWPTRTEDGLTHVYPAHGSSASKVTAQDEKRFLNNPGAQAFIREYIPGEFAGVPLPNGMDLKQITHVYVQRLGTGHQTRIPLTREQYEARLLDIHGVDVETLKTQFEEASKENPDDPFILPRDTQRLSLVAAAAGMRSVFIDYPNLTDDSNELEEAARTICAATRQAWPDVTNDYKAYCDLRQFMAIFVKQIVAVLLVQKPV